MGEYLPEGAETDEGGLSHRGLAVADQLLPQVKMFGGHADVGDVDVRAAQFNVFEAGVSPLRIGKARFHHFTRADAIVQFILCFHALGHQPVHHLPFERGNVGGNGQHVLGLWIKFKSLVHARHDVGEHASLVGDVVDRLGAGQPAPGREADQDDGVHLLCGVERIQYPLDHGLASHVNQRFGITLGIGIQGIFWLGDATCGYDSVHKTSRYFRFTIDDLRLVKYERIP